MRGGIDLGGTKIQAVVVDSKWNVVGQSRHPTPTKGKPAGVAKEMANASVERVSAPAACREFVDFESILGPRF